MLPKNLWRDFYETSGGVCCGTVGHNLNAEILFVDDQLHDFDLLTHVLDGAFTGSSVSYYYRRVVAASVRPRNQGSSNISADEQW